MKARGNYKTCIGECGQKLHISNFHKYDSRCIFCYRKAKNKWYQKNKKQTLGRQKSYYGKNKEKILSRTKSYYDKHPKKGELKGRKASAKFRMLKYKGKCHLMTDRQLKIAMSTAIKDTAFFAKTDIYQDLRDLQMEMFSVFCDKGLDYSFVEKKARRQLEDWKNNNKAKGIKND